MPSVAVIGAGQWGKNLVRNFSQLGALHSVCDSHPPTLERIGKEHAGVRTCLVPSEVLKDEEVRAVAIATPAGTHYGLAREALYAGKDVFVEKPLALNVRQGRELVELAEETSRVLMVGHLLRYHPAIRKLKNLTAEGALGKVQYIYSNRLNIGRFRSEENILWSFAPHDISTLLYLLAEQPNYVSAHGASYLNPEVPDVTVTMLEFRSGVKGHIFVSWLHPFKEQKLVLVGDRRMAVFNDVEPDFSAPAPAQTGPKLLLFNHGVDWVDRLPVARPEEAEQVPFPKEEPLRVECEHFLESIATRQPPDTDGEEGLRVLQVLAACQKSLDAEGAKVAVGIANGEWRMANGGGGDWAIRNSQSAIPPSYFAHETAVIDEPCVIGPGTKIWHFSHVMAGASIGKDCVLGQNVHVASGVIVGNNVKIENNVSLFAGVVLEDNVFCGPSCVFTNVTNPRSEIARRDRYERTVVGRGATIGANATILCGTRMGRYAFIGAGAMVRGNVPDYALMVGVPAVQKGWMGRHGHKLLCSDSAGMLTCPKTGWRYQEIEPGTVRCLDWPEDKPLPAQGGKERQ